MTGTVGRFCNPAKIHETLCETYGRSNLLARISHYDYKRKYFSLNREEIIFKNNLIIN